MANRESCGILKNSITGFKYNNNNNNNNNSNNNNTFTKLACFPLEKKEETSVCFDNGYNFCTTPQILTKLLNSKLYQI